MKINTIKLVLLLVAGIAAFAGASPMLHKYSPVNGSNLVYYDTLPPAKAKNERDTPATANTPTAKAIQPGTNTATATVEANKYKEQTIAFEAYVKQISDAESQADAVYIKNEATKKELEDELVKCQERLYQLEAQKLKVKQDNIKQVYHTGSGIITFKGARYFVYVADLDSDDINLHWTDAKGKPYISIGNLLHSYKSNPPLMITNGGMFNPNISPEGLFIANGEKKSELNTSQPNHENFYLKPNGIFYIAKDSTAHIDTTSAAFKNVIPGIREATQSGPMLVINGKIHDKFTRASVNRKIRSGVGIISPKKVVFIISETEVNFFDFATIFKDVYNCQNALFLDGAISMMYLNDINPSATGGYFCTLISVTRKPHAK